MQQVNFIPNICAPGL